MNLFLNYQVKIFKSIKVLEKKKTLKFPKNLKNFIVELPPKNQNGDISCNAALILAKPNNSDPIKIAKIIKEHLLSNFKEFKKIDIAGPGFLNIYFNSIFWEKFLDNVINLKDKYGSNKTTKKR